MIFSSILFIFRFLPIALILYYITPQKYKNLILTLLSLVFYSWGEGKYFLIMIASIIIDYTAGRLIYRYKNEIKKKTIVLCISLVFNLGLLFFFKYFNFFIDNINNIFNLAIKGVKITLPLGISFYTFQTMSYSIDVYRGKIVPEKNIINFAAFVTLFPQLIAGPIVKYTDINKEISRRVITKDNVKISVDNVIFYKLLNAKDAVYNIEDYKSGIVYSATTNMRNILGNMSLDEILSGRDKINQDLLSIIDEVTDAYGIKILSVEIKNIIPPAEIQNAMEKQMKAERDKRAMILQAEGQRQSQIEKANGEKQAKILQAEAEKEANIRRAEGLKESQLLEAEGKAKAIEQIAIAESEAIRKVNQAIIESGTDERVIALKQVEALKEMANNPANKLILPNETLSSLGSIAAIGEMLKGEK